MFASRFLAAGFLAVTMMTTIPVLVQAQTGGRWVREFFGHYFDRESAASIAADINRGQSSTFRNATYEQTPHPVTRTFGVYAERWVADENTAAATPAKLPRQNREHVTNGQLTKGHPLDSLRKGHHTMVYTFQLTAGQEYTIDLMSGDGKSGPHNPGYFDTWLRIEDAGGTVLRQDDDGGEGFNSQAVFTPTQTGTFRLVVTTYSAGATGSYTLRLRF